MCSSAEIHVTLAPALLRLFPAAEARCTVSADTVDRLLSALNDRWPGIRDRIADERPAIRRHMNVFVDGQRATLTTSLKPGATVYILTAVSGG